MDERRINKNPEDEIVGAAGRIRRGGNLRQDDNVFFKRRVETKLRMPDLELVKDIVRLQHANVLRVLDAFAFPKSVLNRSSAVVKFNQENVQDLMLPKNKSDGMAAIPSLESSLERVDKDFTVAQASEVCKFEKPLFVINPDYDFSRYLDGIQRKKNPTVERKRSIMDRVKRTFLNMPGFDDDLSPIIVTNYVKKRLEFVDERDRMGEEGLGFRFGFVEGKPDLHGDRTHEGRMLQDRLEELRTEELPSGVFILKPKTAAFMHMHGLLNGVEFNTKRHGVLDDGMPHEDRFLTYDTYNSRLRISNMYDAKTTLAACYNIRKEVMLEHQMNIDMKDLVPLPKQ